MIVKVEEVTNIGVKHIMEATNIVHMITNNKKTNLKKYARHL